MALDRWLALVILVGCVAYGYTAWFLMDGSLPPFMRRNPVWPSTFPKVLSIAGALVALLVVLRAPPPEEPGDGEIDYRRLHTYHLVPALALVGLMVAYALTLRPLGFLLATTLFLTLSALVLGERRLHVLLPVAALATFIVWWLVQDVLGIYLRGWPSLLAGG
jgi:putative tricarboxylic transport membrane protein